MKTSTQMILNNLFLRYPILLDCKVEIEKSTMLLIETFNNNCKLLVAGNGGSAADALHIVGELMKSFSISRNIKSENALPFLSLPDGDKLINNLEESLPAISLINESALITAYSNDNLPELSFAQQIYGLGCNGDIFLAISTSGNSGNIFYAVQTAIAKKLSVIGLTGKHGGKLKDLCNVCICVPEVETYKIQELHLPIYHSICLALENEFFGDE